MGYLEGALEAAQRIERSLLNRRALKPEPGGGDAGGGNETSLEQFRAWVGLQHDSAFTGYRYRLNLSLSRQQREQLTQRALLESVEEVFSAALARLEGLPFQTEGVAIERGRSGLTPLVQAPFGPFLKSLVEDVVAFNRTSCALSNFPWEHKLDGEYMQVILRDIAAAWQEFSRSVNTLLLVK
jgi:monoamine oxidase